MLERRPGRDGRHDAAPIAKPSWRRWASDDAQRRSSATRSSTGATASLKRLGSGGMADVYCAEDHQLGRRVALKLLHRRFAEDERVRRALPPRGVERRRACSTRTSSAVFDRGEWDGTYYIAMEFLEGRTLKQIVRERRPRSTRGARSTSTIQILRAARFAHKRGIVHRDIKPHNVLVDDEGRAQVTDFGIARAGASDMTETGSIMGTAQYLSPEQAQGHAGRRALGPLLDRRRALRAADGPRAVRRRVAGHHRAQAGLRAAGAADASSTRRSRPRSRPSSMRALEKDPAGRFADADEFIAALEAARAAPARGDPAAAADRSRRSSRRSEPTAALVAVAAARAARAGWRSRSALYLLLRPEKSPCRTWSAASRRPPRRRCRTAASRSTS